VSTARRALLGAVTFVCAAAAALVEAPAPAWACSCAVVDPEAALDGADAAFVGTLETRRESNRGPVRSTGDPVTLGFRVEQVLKGDLGERVEVVTAASGASCGIEARPGERLTLLLSRDRGRWQSGLCDRLAAERLDVHRFTEEEGRSRWWLLLAAGGGIAAAAAAAFALRRRRRTA
jgi:hypothetical protein